jgi:glutamate-ammonia-ligase adenylyltransferase
MEIATLVSVLDHPHQAADQLHAWGLSDVHRAQRTLQDLADSGLTLDLMAPMCGQLREHLPRTGDPDRMLDGLARFVFAARSPLALGGLFERDAAALPMLLASLDLGPRWTELLVEDPEALDLLRACGGQLVRREDLVGELMAEALAFSDERQVSAALGRARRRHELRIAYGETTGSLPTLLAMEQLTLLTEAIVETALAACQRLVPPRPRPGRSHPAGESIAVIALGRLGGGEMDYASPLELLVIYDVAGPDAALVRSVREHSERMVKLLIRLLEGTDARGSGYQVSLAPLPDAQAQLPAHLADDVLLGFDSLGRTWHRRAMLRARPIAGDRELGEAILERLRSWLFRRYLSPADDTGMQAWKRRILVEATLHQDEVDPLSGRGGLRDIEATVQFLQLLAGGDRPDARARGTLAAIAGLQRAGALNASERMALEESYLALRRIEHRQQIDERTNAREEVAEQLRQTWPVLERLLGSAFAEEPPWPREVELLLDPQPSEEEIRAALAPFGFGDPRAALATLQQLAQEQIPFLSTRRCRHALAQILPRLLCAVAATPNADRTLANLLAVSNSLGGKGVLWELLRWHQPSLQLYVTLCAASPYLSSILTTNPGMIDELIDSLQLHDLPALADLHATLAELCRGASDTLPVLHDFKNVQHLRIGVRDILGREDIDRTHQSLADVAEVCLAHVVDFEYERLVEKFGVPAIGPGPFEGQPCPLVIVGLGKLGGREPNYHSDLAIAFLYEAEGLTRPPGRSRRGEQTTNNHFFTQLAQRVLKQVAQLTPKGRLYSIDALLRPIGVGGALALPFADFQQHFSAGAAQPAARLTAPLWQWQALCKARPVYGEAPARAQVENLRLQLLTNRPWSEADRQEINRSRRQLERGASPENLKRGPGGTTDVEFLVQMLQLQHAAGQPQVLATNTQDAILRLGKAGALTPELTDQLGDSYRFLRRVESGLRLLETKARHDLPSDGEALHQLALLIGHSNPAKLRERCLAHMAENRAIFDQLTAAQD